MESQLKLIKRFTDTSNGKTRYSMNVETQEEAISIADRIKEWLFE